MTRRRPAAPAWFAFDDDEQRDAERVAELEAAAAAAHPVDALELVAQADELRERWGKPRQPFATLTEIAVELGEVGGELRELHSTEDADALRDLAERVFAVSAALERLAGDVEEHAD